MVRLAEHEKGVEAFEDNHNPDMHLIQASSSQVGGDIERETPLWSGAPEEDSFGLFQLWPDPEVEEERRIKTDVDVIAIHGLGGHPMATWKSGERLWLRDFLPKDLRTARIFTFGYNSGSAFTNSKSRIRDFATQLLEKLVQLQRRTKIENRKTIFVCHSLGGIVLKQAIIMANERGRYSTVGKNIAGVVFLGTPHRGSDIAFWGKTLGKFANFAVFGGIRTDLLNSLAPKSTELADICSQFVERAVPLNIFTIYERIKMKGLPDLVVDETSAVLHLPNETPIPMEADHRGLCRYLTSSSENYIVVRDCITELFDLVVDKVSESVSGLTGQQLRFMQRLALLSAGDLLRPLQHAWGRTSEWLLQHDEFRSWRDLHGRRKALWLQGPPGSGKTVLAKQVVTFLQHERYQEESDSLIRKTIYFFFDDKDPKRRTNESLIASILFQLLVDSRTSFVARYMDCDAVNAQHHLESNLLWECFASVIHRSRGILFFLVIDALDEMEREKSQIRQDVLNQLVHIAANDLSGHLRILITDRQMRPYQFEKAISSEEIDVDNQATRKGIEDFITVKVRSKLEANHLSKERAERIEKELVEISEGNFLRATLTWLQFDRNLKDWSPSAVRKELGALHILPPGLDAFYFEILNSIPTSLRSEARKAFSVIMVAIEPLSIRQLAFLSTLPESDANDAARVFYSPDDFMEFFKKYCAHIVKLDDDGIVSFTHQTVKELLSSKSDSSEMGSILSQFQMPSSDAHNFMLKQCLGVLKLEANHNHDGLSQYMALRKSQKRVPDTVFLVHLDDVGTTPCLRYAVYHWMSHYQDATNDSQVDNKVISFLKKRSTHYYCKIWELNRDFDSLIARNEVALSKANHATPLFHIIFRGDFPALVRLLIKKDDISDFKGEKTFLSPLTWSIMCQRKQSFMFMLNSGLVNVNIQQDDQRSPIYHAVNSEDLFFLKALVNNDNVAVNVSGYEGKTPLHHAIVGRKYAAADILLDQPSIDIRCQDHYRNTPYDLAILDSSAERVVMRLLQIMDDRGYKSISQYQLNPLRLAGSQGWNRMMEKVIEGNASLVVAVDDSGLSPLTWHAYYGEQTQLHWVLQRMPDGILTADTDFGKYNLVNLCAHQGWRDTTEMVMNKFGLKPLDADHFGRNLLHWAIFYGWELGEDDIAKYSMNQLNQQDRDGSTPLHLAILSRDIDIIKLLVSGGGRCVVKDNRGFTPAHLAADSGFRAALQFFIESPYREFGKTREGASLLHYITSWFDAKLIDQFIEAKRPLLDCRDRKGRTPLHYAATADNTSAIESLLKHGASIDQWDQDGRTALHDALRSGGSDSVKVLLEYGADATRLDNFSQSCLQLSARYGHESLGKLMLGLNPRINAGDMFGMTALHRACASGALSLIPLLLKNHADWTRRDQFLDTPLDKAVVRGQTAAVEYFLKWLRRKPVDERTKRDVINSALDRALSEEHVHIEDILVRFGAKPTGRPIKVWRPYVPEERGSNHWPVVVRNPYTRGNPYTPDFMQPPHPSWLDSPKPAHRPEPGQPIADSPSAAKAQSPRNDGSKHRKPLSKTRKKPSRLDRFTSYIAGSH